MLCLLAYLIEKVLELQVLSLGITGRAAFERFRASTVDELELAETGIRQWRVTELGAEQAEVLSAAGIAKERFQEGWRRLE